MSIMARKQEDLESQPDIKKIARLNTTVPAEMFAEWKQRQCEEKKDPRAVSLEFSWLVCSLLPLHTYISLIMVAL